MGHAKTCPVILGHVKNVPHKNTMPSPVPILFLNHDLTSGGAERALLRLLENLDRDRFAPALWVRRKSGDLQPKYETLGIPLRERPGMMSEGARRKLCFKAAVQAPFVRRFQLVHSFCSNAWWTEPWAVRLAGVHYVIRKSDHYLHGPSRSWEVRHRLCHRITSVTHAIADEFYRDTPMASKVRVIHNGIDVEAFRPMPRDPSLRRRLGIPENAVLFANLANLSKYKGQLPLLVALAIAQARDLPLHIAFAGRDLDNGEIQQWAAELGVQDRAHFLGRVTDVPQFLAGCDGSILTSPKEGCSNSVLESLSCGCPVIVTASGAHELIRDGEHGFVIPVGAMQLAVERMLTLGSNPELRIRLATAARRHATESYGIQRMVQAYQATYEELLARPKPQPVKASTPVFSRSL